MNLFWKIIFWTLTIGLGFVNPLITFVMVILYYLPGLIQDICNDNESNYHKERKFQSTQNHTQMKKFSKDVLEESR